MKRLIIFLALFYNSNAKLYNSFTGHPMTDEEIKHHHETNMSAFCSIEVNAQCDPNEWRRLDGSCNNQKHPTYGGLLTPLKRLLEPVYGKDLSDRPSVKGGELPLVRKLRTNILPDGKSSDPVFTNLAPFTLVYIFSNVGSINDTIHYILEKTDCCEDGAKSEYECCSHEIPEDDPVFRFSNPRVRCMNQTRPITYQTYGCLQNGTTTPARISTETASLDQSLVYNYGGNPSQRTYKGGELVVDEVNGKIWPKLIPTKDSTACVMNNLPDEDLCFASTTNGIFPPKFLVVFMYRLHNYMARQLAIVNPCWDDERLFYTTREINIAMLSQIVFYELMKELMGSKNLIREGILSKSKGFRDIYDENELPQIAEEFIFTLRYFHTVIEGDLKMYNNDGHYDHTYPIVNASLNTGVFKNGNNFDQFTQASFRQACGNFDHSVDPLMSEMGLGGLNFASDITMNDLAKSRLLGFPGYVEYLKYCSKCPNKEYKTFEDLLDVMDRERMEILKENYDCVEDIDLMAGMWSERLVPGGHVPHTVYCLLADQLKRFIKSDRHWFERKDRPHAFTEPQLHEIRKVTIASILCTVGDSVDQIQKHAFLRIGPKNPLVSCEEIPMIDFSKWKDNTCEYEDNNIVHDYKKDD